MRILFWLALIALFAWALRGLVRPADPPPGAATERGEEMVPDPVCGVHLPKSRALSSRKGGEVIYFCSRECQREFSAEGKGSAASRKQGAGE